jgi:hypothetical protein
VITNPGMVLNLPLGSLAYLGRARALVWRGVLPTLRIRIEIFFDCGRARIPIPRVCFGPTTSLIV